MTTTDTKLTRAEAAYAHLASFAKGERVVIGGHTLHSSEAVIKHPQTFPDNSAAIEGAYLVAAVSGIGGEGGWAEISVADLLAGQHVEHDGEHQWNGNLTCFDAAGYAAQNRDELQARVDAELRERAYDEAHYLNNASAYFPGDHP